MTSPLMDIRGLTKTFSLPGGPLRRLTGRGPRKLTALNDVSLQIHEGEILSIVGESGSGKTTLGRALLRLEEPTAGEVDFRGQDLLKLSHVPLLAARRELQMIFQDPWSSLNPRLSIRQTLAEVLYVHGIATGARAQARIAELLNLVGLPPEAADRYPRHFSGGQRQRIGIARALAVAPSFLVADEPVSAVDVSVQAQIMNLLIDLRARLGLTMLIIAHDLSVVRYISDRVGVMYFGRIVEMATSDRIFSSPRHPYSQGLLRAAPRPDPSRLSTTVAIHGEPPSPLNPPKGCAFHTRCPWADARCRTETPALTELHSDHTVACHNHDQTTEFT